MTFAPYTIGLPLPPSLLQILAFISVAPRTLSEFQADPNPATISGWKHEDDYCHLCLADRSQRIRDQIHPPLWNASKGSEE